MGRGSETAAGGHGRLRERRLAPVVVVLAVLAPLLAIGAVIVPHLRAPLSSLDRALFALALAGGAGLALAGLGMDRNRLWFRLILDRGLPALSIHPFTHSLVAVPSVLTAGAVLSRPRAS